MKTDQELQLPVEDIDADDEVINRRIFQDEQQSLLSQDDVDDSFFPEAVPLEQLPWFKRPSVRKSNVLSFEALYPYMD